MSNFHFSLLMRTENRCLFSNKHFNVFQFLASRVKGMFTFLYYLIENIITFVIWHTMSQRCYSIAKPWECVLLFKWRNTMTTLEGQFHHVAPLTRHTDVAIDEKRHFTSEHTAPWCCILFFLWSQYHLWLKTNAK